MILVTRHSRLFCSSKMLRAKFNRIWLRLYSWTDISKSCAFWMPMPQKVKYLRKISTSCSSNSMQPVQWNDRIIDCGLNRIGLKGCRLTIRFIDDLSHAYDVALVVANGHAKNRVGLVAGLQIDFAIESCILVCLLYVNHLLCLGHHAGNTNAEWNDNFLCAGPLHCILQSCRNQDETQWNEMRRGEMHKSLRGSAHTHTHLNKY